MTSMSRQLIYRDIHSKITKSTFEDLF